MPISEQELHELEDVHHRTSTGMWSLIATDHTYIQAVIADQASEVAQVKRLVDGDFIAAAHRAVPLMIVEIRQLRAERDRSVWKRLLKFVKGR